MVSLQGVFRELIHRYDASSELKEGRHEPCDNPQGELSKPRKLPELRT